MPQSRSITSLFSSLLFRRDNDGERQVRPVLKLERVGTLVCAANPDLAHKSIAWERSSSSSSEKATDSGVSAPKFRLPTSYSGVSAMRNRGGWVQVGKPVLW